MLAAMAAQLSAASPASGMGAVVSADILALPPGSSERVRELASIIVGATSGSPVCHAVMGLKGRLTGAARRARGRLWFEVDVGSGDNPWWAAGNILRIDHHKPIPLIEGTAA